jgi:hypothetical protein
LDNTHDKVIKSSNYKINIAQPETEQKNINEKVSKNDSKKNKDNKEKFIISEKNEFTKGEPYKNLEEINKKDNIMNNQGKYWRFNITNKDNNIEDKKSNISEIKQEKFKIEIKKTDITNKDLKGICSKMGNVLEDVTIPLHPVIADIKANMMENGAVGAMMSGSGPTVFGFFEDNKTARAAKDALTKTGMVKQLYLTTLFNN